MFKFWIGGKNSVLSALNNNKRKVHRLVIAKEFKELEKLNIKKNTKQFVNQSFFKRIFKDQNFVHQGIAAEVSHIENKEKLFDQKKIIILDGVTDPRNIGAIIRTAIAYNFTNLVIKKKNFSPTSPLMYKSASGAIEKINIFEVVNINNEIDKLKKKNFWIYGLDGNVKKKLESEKNFHEKIVFVFGSENKGISELTKKKCDQIFRLDISRDIESLNVSNAVAATLSIFNFKINFLS